MTNLLNYSRIQGRAELHRVSLDLRDACHSALEMLKIQAHTGDVELSLVEPDTPVRVLADAEELPRVIDIRVQMLPETRTP